MAPKPYADTAVSAESIDTNSYVANGQAYPVPSGLEDEQKGLTEALERTRAELADTDKAARMRLDEYDHYYRKYDATEKEHMDNLRALEAAMVEITALKQLLIHGNDMPYNASNASPIEADIARSASGDGELTGRPNGAKEEAPEHLDGSPANAESGAFNRHELFESCQLEYIAAETARLESEKALNAALGEFISLSSFYNYILPNNGGKSLVPVSEQYDPHLKALEEEFDRISKELNTAGLAALYMHEGFNYYKHAYEAEEKARAESARALNAVTLGIASMKSSISRDANMPGADHPPGLESGPHGPKPSSLSNEPEGAWAGHEDIQLAKKFAAIENTALGCLENYGHYNNKRGLANRACENFDHALKDARHEIDSLRSLLKTSINMLNIHNRRLFPSDKQYGLLGALYSGIAELNKRPNDPALRYDVNSRFDKHSKELCALNVPLKLQYAAAEAGLDRNNWGLDSGAVIREVCGAWQENNYGFNLDADMILKASRADYSIKKDTLYKMADFIDGLPNDQLASMSNDERIYFMLCFDNEADDIDRHLNKDIYPNRMDADVYDANSVFKLRCLSDRLHSLAKRISISGIANTNSSSPRFFTVNINGDRLPTIHSDYAGAINCYFSTAHNMAGSPDNRALGYLDKHNKGIILLHRMGSNDISMVDSMRSKIDASDYFAVKQALNMIGEVNGRPRGEDADIKRGMDMGKGKGAAALPGIAQGKEEASAKDMLLDQLMGGVRSVIDSGTYKDWLNTAGKLFYNHYSFNNSLLVFLQKPDATHVMGYEAWKEFGRNVRQGAKGAKILIPSMASEKTKGALFGAVKRSLNEQLASNPAATQASYRLGQSKLEFTMNRANHLIGIKINGKEVGVFSSDDDCKRYIDRSILGKAPMYYSVGTVFDSADVIVPEFLWLKRGFTKDEVVRNDKDKPITNKRGETKIYNTPERQARFTPALDMGVAAQDPVKMGILFDACAAVCHKNGVAVQLRDKESDGCLKEGASGYYSREPQEGFPNGLIAIKSDLEATEKCVVMFHEMGHADLHKNLGALAKSMGEDKISKAMREQQAQSVSYGVASAFGIPADSFSFNYIAEYSKGFELQELHKSLGVIYNEVRAITNELKAELDKAGFNLDLTEKPKAALGADAIDAMSKSYISLALGHEAKASSAGSDLPRLVMKYRNAPEILDILKGLKSNLDITGGNVELIKSTVELLNKAGSRVEQDDCVAVLEQAQKRISECAHAFDSLSDQFVFVTNKIKGGLKSDFDKDPRATIELLKKDHPCLSKLTEAQTNYVATSKYISSKFGKLLRSNVPSFVEKACERASLISDYASKNGTFIEINSCEKWLDKPIFEGGELCHPSVADSTLRQAEIQIRGFKQEAEKRGEYFPYTKCDLTVYSPTASYGLSALNTIVDIGDNGQSGLSDHLASCCGHNKLKGEIFSNFRASLKEPGALGKIFAPSSTQPPTAEKAADATYVDMSLSMSAWEKKISTERSSVSMSQPSRSSAPYSKGNKLDPNK